SRLSTAGEVSKSRFMASVLVMLFRLSVNFDYRFNLIKLFHEGFQYPRIELFCHFPAHNLECLVKGKRFPVAAVVGQRVEDVCDFGNPCLNRYLFPLFALGVTAAVPGLMVLVSNDAGSLEHSPFALREEFVAANCV